jgi:hypothetical protein
MHARTGEPVFALSPNLVTLLLDTEIPTIDLEMLRLPYPCILIDISKSPIPIKDTEVTHLYLAQPEDKFRVLAGCADTTGIFVNLITGKEFGLKTVMDAFDATVAKALVENAGEIDDPVLRTIAAINQVQHHWKENKDKFMQQYKNILTVAINAVLYITSPDADIVRGNENEIRKLTEKLQGVKKGFKREQLESLLAKERNRKIRIVGRSIMVQPEYNAHFTEEGRKVVFRHRVRGHWKLQVHGKNRENRKQIWIQPYWRGPDMAELLARNYVVQTPKN